MKPSLWEGKRVIARLLQILSLFPALILIQLCILPTPAWPDSAANLEAKIGQMLITGFRGLEVDESSNVIRDIRAGRIGGVILFAEDKALQSPQRNVASPEQVRKLVSELQAASTDMPLFVAITREGGSVDNLPENSGFSASVSQEWLGGRNDKSLTFEHTRQTARIMAELGINVNLAPVVDVNINPDNTLIGQQERCFSADPQVVADHAQEMIIAHQIEGVLCALKHFPGHGSSTGTHHLGFTDVTQTWSEAELLPYQKILASSGADMIMVGRIFNADLDPDWPAPFSSLIVRDLLRDQMGYQGVVVVDDIQTQEVMDHYGLEKALERIILAGADLIILGNNQIHDSEIATKAVTAILMLVQNGRVPRERILESAARIMHLKSRLVDHGNQECRLCDAY